MKKKLLFVIFLALALKAKAGNTNYVYSQLTISNMFYTNRIAMIAATSNNTYVASNYNYSLTLALSNLNWFVTNGAITTNIAVIVPNSKTNQLQFTNGFMRGNIQIP